MKIGKKIAIGCVVVALAGGGYAWYSASTPNDVAMMMAGTGTVVTSTVTRGDMRQVVTANGSVELERVEPIYSSAQGETRLRVAEVLVEVGDYVVEGQPIVTYDIEESLIDIDRRIRQSAIRLENQRMSLRDMTAGPSEQEYRQLRGRVYSAIDSVMRAENLIIEAQAVVADRESRINTARREIENTQRTYNQEQAKLAANQQIFALGGITRDELEQNAADVEDARQAVTDAQIALDTLFVDIEGEDRAYAALHRDFQDALRNLANEELAYELGTQPLSTPNEQTAHTIATNDFELAQIDHNSLLEERERLISETVSHTSGMVTEVEVSVGAQVTGTSKLIEVADFSNLVVTAEVREADAPQVFVGQSVTMTSAGIAGTVYTGTVIRVSPTAITRQAQMGNEIVVPIEISVDNPDQQLRPGFSVDLEIVMVESLDTVSVSLMSVMQDFETGQEYVMLIDDNDILRRRDITRGISTTLDIEVLDGLEGHERIVLTPNPMMQDGDPLPEDAVEGGSFMMGGGDSQGGSGGGGGVRIGGGGGGAVMIRR
ncbi:MAG: efflux RND transporter periplasmic adaptor subunit [Defluviitaleaceae bacterium]|nr:efflux RND transporter periplasmic adaptor subunit [Defluviitaleaceae bacterium]